MSLGDFGRDMLAEAARIAQQTVAREGTHLRWATVTDTEPLRIRYDGEPNQSIVTPQTTAAGLDIGDRVQVAKQHGQATIIGPADGHRAITDGTNTLRIGDDGSPRLWSDPELVYDRTYTGSVAPDDTRLMVSTNLGTFGTLSDQIGRNYLGRASGDVTLTVPSGQTQASTTVTFPAGRFTAPPNVALAAHSTASTLINYSVTAISTTSCTINVHRTSTAQTIIDWVAVQP